MSISCAFACSLSTPEHIALAERLGYRRAWCFDSPALYADVWMTLSRAAERTTTIGLGPGVLVPSLRHPMVNAAAIATLASEAPGRIAVAIGAGFTGRVVLGQRPMRWSDVAEYARVLRALLRGEDAEWEGRVLRMLHPAGFGGPPSSEIPVLIAADGPKGLAVANELGDGVFSTLDTTESDARWRALLANGTVLDEGEDLTSERVLDAAGAALARIYHGRYERLGAAGVDALPGGSIWRAAIESQPEVTRHLAVHEGHLIEANERDRLMLEAGAELLPQVTMTGTASQVRSKVARLIDTLGFTEIVFQPMGSNISRELESFAEATASFR